MDLNDPAYSRGRTSTESRMAQNMAAFGCTSLHLGRMQEERNKVKVKAELRYKEYYYSDGKEYSRERKKEHDFEIGEPFEEEFPVIAVLPTDGFYSSFNGIDVSENEIEIRYINEHFFYRSVNEPEDVVHIVNSTGWSSGTSQRTPEEKNISGNAIISSEKTRDSLDRAVFLKSAMFSRFIYFNGDIWEMHQKPYIAVNNNETDIGIFCTFLRRYPERNFGLNETGLIVKLYPGLSKDSKDILAGIKVFRPELLRD